MPGRALAGCEYNVNKECYTVVLFVLLSFHLHIRTSEEEATYKEQIMYASTIVMLLN